MQKEAIKEIIRLAGDSPGLSVDIKKILEHPKPRKSVLRCLEDCFEDIQISQQIRGVIEQGSDFVPKAITKGKFIYEHGEVVYGSETVGYNISVYFSKNEKKMRIISLTTYDDYQGAPTNRVFIQRKGILFWHPQSQVQV